MSLKLLNTYVAVEKRLKLSGESTVEKITLDGVRSGFACHR